MRISDTATLKQTIWDRLNAQTILDIHTHLYDPAFGNMLLWGIDELITYHYLIAETFRRVSMPYDAFFDASKREQADTVFKTLFLESTPVSEATRGVLTTAKALGYPLTERNLDAIRAYIGEQNARSFVDTVFKLSGVKQAIMTNDPFDDKERAQWLEGPQRDGRFLAALRIDTLLLDWRNAAPKLHAMGYDVKSDDESRRLSEVKHFLMEWGRRMEAKYMAVSLSDEQYPKDSWTDILVRKAVLPACQALDIPFALMIGVRRQQNPGLRLAGDSVHPADLGLLAELCRDFPRNRFMATLLSRENQHELSVIGRKFRNLMVFGCWWFLNNPSFIEEMTRMRIELLGTSFIPQHSDARVLDQLIYKWSHSKAVIGEVLYRKYADMLEAGWHPEDTEIERDINDLIGGGNLDRFMSLRL